MHASLDRNLVDVLLDSWDRNNRILVNLLRVLPEGGLEARAIDGGPTVAQLFCHAHYVRLVFITENVPDFPVQLPEEEWKDERSADLVAEMLEQSSAAVRDAVERCVREGKEMERHYDHPVLFLQMMIWHEGYHHGQIKLALKLSGLPLADQAAGRVTWGVWMRKTARGGKQA